MAKSKSTKEIEKTIEMIEPEKKESFLRRSKDLIFNVWVVVSIIILIILLVPTKTEIKEVEVSYTGEENYTQEIPYITQEPFEVKLWYELEPNCVNDPDCYCIVKSKTTGECMRCVCHVDINSTRKLESFRIVTVYGNVTKYKAFNKTRTVVKTKTEEHAEEINWIFGFKVPYKLHLPFISG